jgi:acetyl-CoA C-acetyltransferase
LQLVTQVLVALRERNRLDTALIDDVGLGCATPIGEQGAVLARVAAVHAGYSDSVPGHQINRGRASALDAVSFAAARIFAGQSDAAIAGGVESMSRVPVGPDGGAAYADPQVTQRVPYVPDGVCADLIATLDRIGREQLDAYAVESQRRAAQAWDEGRFDASVVPVRDLLGKTLLARDEHSRPGTTLADLARLEPAFMSLGEVGFDGVLLRRYPQLAAIEHFHTSGTSGGIVDGAAAVLLGSAEFGRKTGLRPRARICAWAELGSEPLISLSGSAAATRKALARAGLRAADIDLFEVNEAFSSVVLRFMREMELPHDKINVNGGAIALGDPLGATGAMLLGTALDELERRDASIALVTLCAGYGMAVATVIERV